MITPYIYAYFANDAYNVGNISNLPSGGSYIQMLLMEGFQVKIT